MLSWPRRTSQNGKKSAHQRVKTMPRCQIRAKTSYLQASHPGPPSSFSPPLNSSRACGCPAGPPAPVRFAVQRSPPQGRGAGSGRRGRPGARSACCSPAGYSRGGWRPQCWGFDFNIHSCRRIRRAWLRASGKAWVARYKSAKDVARVVVLKMGLIFVMCRNTGNRAASRCVHSIPNNSLLTISPGPDPTKVAFPPS